VKRTHLFPAVRQESCLLSDKEERFITTPSTLVVLLAAVPVAENAGCPCFVGLGYTDTSGCPLVN